MHEAKMMRQQGKKIRQIDEALGKSERTIHYYLSQPTRRRKKRKYTSKLDPFKPYIDTIHEEDPSINREVLLRNLADNKEKFKRLQAEGYKRIEKELSQLEEERQRLEAETVGIAEQIEKRIQELVKTTSETVRKIA